MDAEKTLEELKYRVKQNEDARDYLIETSRKNEDYSLEISAQRDYYKHLIDWNTKIIISIIRNYNK